MTGSDKQNLNLQELQKTAGELRGMLVEMSHACGVAHLGSSLSCVDILVALYFNVLNVNPDNPDDPERDRFILSKGHAAAALYGVLTKRGFLPIEDFFTCGQAGSNLAEHPGPNCVPGVEAATGSLGHGLSIGLGMALAARLQKKSNRVFVVLSDGECNEGSVWEAAMFAAKHELGAVTAFIDYNKWQATGRSTDVLALEPLREKWNAFGWKTFEIDGHDIESIIHTTRQACGDDSNPTMIIAHTVKGKGVSFMEDDNNWHYRIPTEEEVRLAKEELGLL